VTATSTPEASINADKTFVFAGPANLGYDTVTTLPKDAKVAPVGVYGKFVKVQFTVGGQIQEGFVPVSAIENLPADLTVLSPDQVPWAPVDYAKSRSASGPAGFWDIDPDKVRPADIVNINGEALVDFTLEGKGDRWLILSGAGQNGSVFVGFESGVFKVILKTKIGGKEAEVFSQPLSLTGAFDGNIQMTIGDGGNSVTISSPTGRFDPLTIRLDEKNSHLEQKFPDS
jgi:hypothetical protein